MGTSTNKHGVTHFTLTRNDEDEADLDELMRVLVDRFGAVDDGELLGPYSLHRYVKVGDLRLGIILDEPEWLFLYETEGTKMEAMASFVTRLLEALNAPPR
jgi:hypothetical protein